MRWPIGSAGMTGIQERKSSLIAALPMYDWPEIRSAWDELWSLARANLARSGQHAPRHLIHDGDDRAHWTDPLLLLGQTCGWPFVSRLRDKVKPLARFDFALAGNPAGHYHSVFVTREFREFADPLAIGSWLVTDNPRIAINAADSQSGCRAFGECFADRFDARPGSVCISGSHRRSIRLVATGEADICAVDAVSWRLALAHEPAARGLHIAARSAAIPGLPLITSNRAGVDPDAICDALEMAIKKMGTADRAKLGLSGLVRAGADDYDVLLEPPYYNFLLPET
jgi:ABC-type phosphate/phosphonate transport system substrate-binding protein